MSNTIYVVDDTADYRFLVRQILVKFLPQYDVHLFESGDALCDVIATGALNQLPKLILLDLHMPGRDGVATLRFIRQTESWADVPVVVMSSAVQQTDIEACYEAGASSVMQKPIAFDQLTDRLKTVCQYWLDVDRQP